jgi:hypothetical protein
MAESPAGQMDRLESRTVEEPQMFVFLIEPSLPSVNASKGIEQRRAEFDSTEWTYEDKRLVEPG